MSAVGLVWGAAPVVKAPKFQDIMVDQQFGSADVAFTRSEEDDDYMLALRLQNEEVEKVVGTTGLEDQQLAECIQQIENEELSQKSTPHNTTNTFTKINVQLESGCTNSGKQYSVCSSEFGDAVQLESRLQHFSKDKQRVFKHDSLLQGLSNSASLSELDGVGDLFGSKLLVSNTVANSLKTFVNKNEDRQNQIKYNRQKKNAMPSVPLTLSSGTSHLSTVAVETEPSLVNAAADTETTAEEEQDDADYVLVESS